VFVVGFVMVFESSVRVSSLDRLVVIGVVEGDMQLDKYAESASCEPDPKGDERHRISEPTIHGPKCA